MTSIHEPLAKLLGADLNVPVFGEKTARYINLDNAATTPVLQRVWDRLAEIMPWYGSVHRGAGFKSVVSTRLFEDATEKILKFSDADPDKDALIFGWNTTSCINHLARRLKLTKDEIVVASEMEHSSNLLPWKKHATLIKCNSTSDGSVDLNELEDILKSRQARLVAVTAASNVTGVIVDVHAIARIAHLYGASIFIDAAQLVAHRRLNRFPHDAPEHLDFVAYAGHKMYAPLGAGVLIGPREVFSKGWPDTPGGGTVHLIDGEHIVWADLPERERGGTPNFPGIVALAEACDALLEIGFDKIAERERLLTEELRKQLMQLPDVTVHRPLTQTTHDRVALFPFSVRNRHHSLVATFLGGEHAVGVRSGQLCQYEFVNHLLHVSDSDRVQISAEAKSGDRRRLPGVVRASCGLGTTVSDLSVLTGALHELVTNGPQAIYEQQLDGEFQISNWSQQPPKSLTSRSALIAAKH